MAITVNSKKKQVKKTFQELINDLMSSSSEKVRYNAARVLGEMGDSKAVEPLIDVLKNDDVILFWIVFVLFIICLLEKAWKKKNITYLVMVFTQLLFGGFVFYKQ